MKKQLAENVRAAGDLLVVSDRELKKECRRWADLVLTGDRAALSELDDRITTLQRTIKALEAEYVRHQHIWNEYKASQTKTQSV